jgi:hypothetical protein
MKFLKDTKYFVLLIPGNSAQTFAVAVGVMIGLDEQIVMPQFSEQSLQVDRPIRIGHFFGI